jgi:hypothetical protein
MVEMPEGQFGHRLSGWDFLGNDVTPDLLADDIRTAMFVWP